MSELGETPPEKLWLVLAKCYKSMADYARAQIEDSGLGLSDFEVLEALMHKGPLAISSIGAKVLLTSGSMTAAVNRLVEKDLVRRVADEEDRRVQRVELTKTGRKLITATFRKHRAALQKAMAVLTDKERGQMTSLLKKLGLFTQQLRTEKPASAQLARKQKGKTRQ